MIIFMKNKNFGFLCILINFHLINFNYGKIILENRISFEFPKLISIL